MQTAPLPTITSTDTQFTFHTVWVNRTSLDHVGNICRWVIILSMFCESVQLYVFVCAKLASQYTEEHKTHVVSWLLYEKCFK